MKTKLILLCSILVNIGLLLFIIITKSTMNNNSVNKTEKYKITSNSSVVNIYSEDNTFECLMDKETEKLISFNHYLPDLSQSASIETKEDNLQRISYHGKDFTLTLIKFEDNEESDYSLGIYKHKKDNPYRLDYYAQFIFDKNGNYKTVE